MLHAAERNRHVLGYLEQPAPSRDGIDPVTSRAWAGGVAISPDGRTVAAMSPDDGQVRVYDAETRAQLASTVLEGGRTGSYAPPMRFADDTRLAVVDGDIVAVYNARTLAPAARLDGSASPEATAIFNRQPVQALLPDYARGFSDTTVTGTVAAVLHDYATLEIWSAGSGSGPPLSTALPGDANWDTVAFSDDGTTVVVGNDSGGMLLFRGSLRIRCLSEIYRPGP